MASESIFDLVVFHYHNPLKSFFAKQIVLEEWRIEISGVTLEFTEDLKGVKLGIFLGERWESEYLHCHYMPTIVN